MYISRNSATGSHVVHLKKNLNGRFKKGEQKMSDLRERIERALFDATERQPRGVGGQVVSFYGFDDMPLRLRKIIQDQADAVLAVLGEEFAHGRPASMPDMSGRQQWTIVGGPYSSRDVAERMAKTRPVVKDLPVTVLTRIVSEWEEADDE